MFPNFFKKVEGDGDTEPPTYDDMRRNIDAQIRALTKGDITKEREILSLEAIRALTELDAQAREYDDLRKNTRQNEQSQYQLGRIRIFERLTGMNRFAREHAYRFARVSSLDGFHGALGEMTSTTAFVAVSDISQGGIDIENSPHTRRVKTVFLAKRHAVDDMKARDRCMDNMRELFRQFMSVLIQEKNSARRKQCFYRPSYLVSRD